MIKRPILKTGIVVFTILCQTLLFSSLTGCQSKVAFGINTGRVDKTRSAIEKTIDEPERRAAILELINRFEQEAKIANDETIAIRAQIIEANRDYDTTREDLEKLYDELEVLLQRQADTAKRISMDARKLCSEEEWKKIAAHRTEVINFKF